jgi:hypothetical protein
MEYTHNQALEDALKSVEIRRNMAMKNHVWESSTLKELMSGVIFGNGSKAGLEEARDENGDLIGTSMKIELSEQDSRLERAAIYKAAILGMARERSTIGQAILKALWTVYIEALFVDMGAEDGTEYAPDEFMRWLQDTLKEYEDKRYIMQMGYIVSRVLQSVHAAEIARKPFLDQNGAPITVETLISGNRLLGRLIEISDAFEKASDTDKSALLNAAVNARNRSDVQAEADRVTRGGIKIKLPYRQIPHDNGTTDYVFEGLDADQSRLIIAMIGAAGELLL